MTLILNESEIISLFPMEDAIKASDLAFKLQAGTQSVNHQRIRISNKNQFIKISVQNFILARTDNGLAIFISKDTDEIKNF